MTQDREELLRDPAAVQRLRSELATARKIISATHDIYTDADADRPDVICDRNGSVVLGLCKKCGAAEAELDERVCVPTPPAQGDVRERVARALALLERHGGDYPPSREERSGIANDLRAILAALPARTGEPVAWARMRGGIVNHVVTEPREGYQPIFAHPVPEQSVDVKHGDVRVWQHEGVWIAHDTSEAARQSAEAKLETVREALEDLKVRYVALFQIHAAPTYPDKRGDDDLNPALATTRQALAALDTEKAGG